MNKNLKALENKILKLKLKEEGHSKSYNEV